MKLNIPWTSVTVFLGCLVAVVVLISTGHSSDATVTVLIGLLPGIVGAGYAERNSRDIRNGTISAKVAEGTRKVLDETGVTAVAQTSQATTTAALQALTKLLETNTAATNANTAAQTQRGGGPNGGQTV